MLFLGIETSCDETAAAIVEKKGNTKVLSNVINSHIKLHAAYHGVVPEISARSHAITIDKVIDLAMAEAGKKLQDIDMIAVTAGPGLVGGLMLGTLAAKTLAYALKIPAMAINHLEAHALSVTLDNDVPYPYLALIISGGHTQSVVVEDAGVYRRLGSTVDDALGECFDKVAIMLNLSYPGGPEVEKCAKRGQTQSFSFPRPLYGTKHADFSFAGLKTSVRQTIANLQNNHQPIPRDDICASFTAAVTDVLGDRMRVALSMAGVVSAMVTVGGVAANQKINDALRKVASDNNVAFFSASKQYCGDNAAMVAHAGIELAKNRGSMNMDFSYKPRWPLDARNGANYHGKA